MMKKLLVFLSLCIVITLLSCDFITDDIDEMTTDISTTLSTSEDGSGECVLDTSILQQSIGFRLDVMPGTPSSDMPDYVGSELFYGYYPDPEQADHYIVFLYNIQYFSCNYDSIARNATYPELSYAYTAIEITGDISSYITLGSDSFIIDWAILGEDAIQGFITFEIEGSDNLTLPVSAKGVESPYNTYLDDLYTAWPYTE